MKILAVVMLFGVMIQSSVFAQKSKYGKISYEKAINVAGKQRMLSQKIAKVKVLNVVGASSIDLKTELSSAITIFERNLKILDLNSKEQSAKVKALIRQEKSKWNDFKALADNPLPDVKQVLESAGDLLSKCHMLTQAIEEESKFQKQLGVANAAEQLKVETINIAGKQRMLSQKMCLYYAACRAFRKGKNADLACGQYQNIYYEMDETINNLLVNELNNTAIDGIIAQILSVVDQDINTRKKEFNSNKMPLQKVLETSNKLLELFNKLTNQYSLI